MQSFSALCLGCWSVIRAPDDAARANVVSIARVSGQTIKLNVQDNQAVKKGDVLFEIDPEDYRLVLEKAKAELATVDRQLAQAQDTLHRLEPLLPHGFETAENIDKARTAVTTLQAQREGAIATISQELHLSYEGHRTFRRTCHQSQHFGRRPRHPGGSRLLVA